MSQMITWHGREVWVSDHKAEWLAEFGPLLEASTPQADFDAIRGLHRFEQPRWLQRLLMAAKWYDWSPLQMWRAYRHPHRYTIPVWGVGYGQLCHRVTGGSHRRLRHFRCCANCGGPL
jgi:hypothetical protein